MSEMALQLIRRAKEEGWKHLDLGNTGIMGAVPEEVGELAELEELVLSEEWIEWDELRRVQKSTENRGPANKITALPARPPLKLRKLVCSDTQVKDLAPLSKLTQLHRLDCSGTQVQDLAPLSKLTQLQELHCSSTQVQDLAPLSNLTLLQTLSCYNTQVKDLAPLSNLTQLLTLSCYNTQVQDLAPLSNLTQLQTLHCSITKVQDLAPLSNLTLLQSLNCSYTQVKDLAPLRKLTQLQTLHCSYTQVKDLAPISNLTLLQTLHCSYTQVKDLAPVGKLSQLQTLYCYNTQVKDLAPLSNLTQLQTLWCSNTQVKDLSPVNNLTQLHRLDCSDTKVADLAPLSNLTQLQTLWCSNTQVKDLAPLSNLTQLQILYCWDTQVQDLAPLSNITQLQTLYCYDTQVKDLAPLSKLSQLQKLDCSNTQVQDLAALSNLTQLQTLDCSSTQAKDLAPLSKLTQLKELRCSLTQVQDLAPLSKLTQLQILHFDREHITFPPKDILHLGVKGILDYLQQYERNQKANLAPQANWWLKCIIVGNNASGKSSLLKSWQTGKPQYAVESTRWLGYENWKWDENMTLMRPTLPGDSSLEPVRGKPVLRVFDFGGQDYYHDAHHLFFSSDAAYVVLWDQAQNQIGEKTDEEGQVHYHYPIHYWLDAIRYHCQEKRRDMPLSHLEGKTEKVSLATSIGDAETTDEKNTPKTQEALAQPVLTGVALPIHALVLQSRVDESGRQFLPADQLKQQFPWIYDFDGVGIALENPYRLDISLAKFKEMICQIPLLGGPFLATWLWIRDEVAKIGEDQREKSVRGFMDWANEIIRTRAKEARVKSSKIESLTIPPTEAPSLLKYLTSLGLVLHYPDIAELKETVFLHPENLRRELVEILMGLKDRQGYFDAAYVREKFQNKRSTAQPDQLLSLMQQFKMAFRLRKLPDQTDTWVAPLYLSKEPPLGVGLLTEVFERPVCRIVYPYFIHKSVILELFQTYSEQLLAQEGTPAQQQQYVVWRHGMVIRMPLTNELVMVKFFMGKAATPESDEKAEKAIHTTAQEAHIEIYAFKTPKGAQPAKEVLAKLRDINLYWHTREEVTVDGKIFVPMEVLQKASEERQAYFAYKDHTLALEDYAQYVDIPWSRIFISYAQEDEAYYLALEKHLTPLRNREKVALWSKSHLKPGMDKDPLLQAELRRADIVILLLSPDYFASDEIWEKELEEVLARHKKQQCTIAYLQVRDCDVKSTELDDLKPLWDTPITRPDNDTGWNAAVQNLKSLLKPKKGANP